MEHFKIYTDKQSYHHKYKIKRYEGNIAFKIGENRGLTSI